MISRRHSVFFKLHFFFFLALIILVLLFLSALGEQERQKFRLLAHRSMELSGIVEQTQGLGCLEVNRQLAEAGFQVIEGKTPGCETLRLPPPLRTRLLSRNVRVTIYRDEEGYLYGLDQGHCQTYYRDMAEGRTYYFVWFLFFALLGGLVSMYLMLWNNLRPLKRLYDQILLYGEGKETPIATARGKDEISAISNAFSDALEKQTRLKRSRELFLRNIMHELKTPITKGKLIVELEPPSPNRTMLGKLFSRLEHLISQMAQIEKMHAFTLERRDILIEAMIDTAVDNLLIDKTNIRVVGCDRTLSVDPALFTSALQNLIDNAYRHATQYPISVTCDGEKICVANRGEALKRPVEEALQAFVTERGDGGLGLGLYIAQSVSEMHRFALTYRYEEGIHHFCIGILERK